MRFWRLHHPPAPSAAAARLRNGELTHPIRLPGIKCGECGTTWGGSRILPYTLSEALQHKVELRQPWPIDDVAHQRLRDEVLGELHAQGHSIDALRPGDAFQPAILDLAAPPEVDFLWSSESVVLSPKMHRVLTTMPLRGAAFAPVMIRIGRRTHADRRDGRVVARTDPAAYHELVVRAESGYPQGVEPVRFCGSCGRRLFDHEHRQLVMHPEMWKGDQVFLLATTLWIVVTDPVKQMIEGAGATNVEFVSLE